MGEPLLLLRLEGPLQSWGMRARWDVRDTASEPTKSGIVGLLGAALGYRVGDRRLEEELDRRLTLAVRVEHEGLAMVDYHTVTGFHLAADGKYRSPGGGTTGKRPEGPTTIVSPRAYLQDAAFLVILAGPFDLLQRCHDALLRPRWPVFLGRKSCPPSRPVLAAGESTGPLTDRYASLQDALERHEWDCQLRHPAPGRSRPRLQPPEHLRAIVEDPAGAQLRRDALRINPARMYEMRRVTETFIPNPGPRPA